MLVERECCVRRLLVSGPAVHGQGLGSLLVGPLTTGLSLGAAQVFDLEKEGDVTTSVPGLQSSHRSQSSFSSRLRPLPYKPRAIM